MVTEIELFESRDQTPFDSCLWVWMKSEVYKRKVDKRDEFLAHILDAAASIKKHDDRLRRSARDLRTRVAGYTEVERGFFSIYCEM